MDYVNSKGRKFKGNKDTLQVGGKVDADGIIRVKNFKIEYEADNSGFSKKRSYPCQSYNFSVRSGTISNRKQERNQKENNRYMKLKKLITKNNVIFLTVSIAWGLIALFQLKYTILNDVFDFTDIHFEGAIVGQNIFWKEYITQGIYALMTVSAVILFILRKKTGWIFLAICMVFYIVTLVFSRTEQLGAEHFVFK